jgi:hypothetical protein
VLLTFREIQVEGPSGVQLLLWGTRGVRQCTLADFVANRATMVWLETDGLICSPVAEAT